MNHLSRIDLHRRNILKIEALVYTIKTDIESSPPSAGVIFDDNVCDDFGLELESQRCSSAVPSCNPITTYTQKPLSHPSPRSKSSPRGCLDSLLPPLPWAH